MTFGSLILPESRILLTVDSCARESVEIPPMTFGSLIRDEPQGEEREQRGGQEYHVEIPLMTFGSLKPGLLGRVDRRITPK
jgi:hypothetical protein